MDPGQLAQQMKHLLGAATWSDGCPLFGEESVYVVAGQPDETPKRFPWCLISVGSGEFDEEDPDILRQTFSVWVGVQVAGDDIGENAIIGGAIETNSQTQAGRGVLELDVEVRRTIGRLTGADGCTITLSSTASPATQIMENNVQLAFSELNVVAACTSKPSYTEPQRLRLESGTWSWDGAACEARFDFIEYQLVDAGSPVATPAGGDVVYQGTASTTTASVSGTATILAAYGSRDVVEGYSRPIRGAYVEP